MTLRHKLLVAAAATLVVALAEWAWWTQIAPAREPIRIPHHVSGTFTYPPGVLEQAMRDRANPRRPK